jgi:hypothetical protein
MRQPPARALTHSDVGDRRLATVGLCCECSCWRRVSRAQSANGAKRLLPLMAAAKSDAKYPARHVGSRTCRNAYAGLRHE